MTPARLFLALLQTMLALLLVTGVPFAEPSHGRSVLEAHIVEQLATGVRASEESAGDWLGETKRDRDRLDGDDGPDYAAWVPTRPRLIDRARIIAIGCDFSPNAPPSHRPCAAPPTGPPLV